MSNAHEMKKDEVLLAVYDKDIFPDTLDLADIIWKDRPTGKIVLFNEANEIALIGNKVNNFFLLPGGGIEEDESILDGVKRECQEETGCQIEILQELGVTEDFRLKDSRHCISYGYSAKVISYGNSSLTENEKDIGVYVKWLSLPETHALFITQEEAVKKGEVKFYNTCFNILRDSFFVRLVYLNTLL